jgi:isoleucyl-tRNA synthetase
MELGQREKLPFIQHVTMDGKFKPEVKDFAGLSVKPKGNPRETDEKIVQWLEKENKIFSKELITHSYPFCWRCETPLLNYAANSWFVKVTDIKDKLIKNNKRINWVPEHLRDGRFGKWLENARDWAISRSRYWGAPLPVWRCKKCKKIKVIGSIDEIRDKIGNPNKLFLIRHGEAENNVKGILNSLLEVKKYKLTEVGRKQSKELAKILKKEKIDAIFSSPILRAQETAEIIAKELKLKVVFDKRLREVGFGDFNGKSADDFEKVFPSRKSRIGKIDFGVENEEQIQSRMQNFLEDINKKFSGKNIIIVSHGDPIQIFYGMNQNLDLNNSLKGWYPKKGSLKIVYSKPINLHRPYIDEVELKCGCRGIMRRVPEVFDCWFESGSMPYGQFHYPFENKKSFEASFPAEFIAEGVDQTRGWFYTLLVLSTALFDKPAYKNVVANGIILAENGQKMSKRLKNYPDPMDIVEKYGADSLRYYLLSSPAIRAENLNFSEKGVDEVYKKVISKIRNVLSFYEIYSGKMKYSDKTSENILDRWIVYKLKTVKKYITKYIDEYKLDKTVVYIYSFVDDLSNWYIRRSRERFKQDTEDSLMALNTTRYILKEFSKLIAPFMPFVAEEVYQKVKIDSEESVHLETWPETEELTEEGGEILRAMHDAKGSYVPDGHYKRGKLGINVRQPLSVAKLGFNENTNLYKIEKNLQGQIMKLIGEDLNTKKVVFDSTVGELAVEFDTEITDELKQEGMLRELVRNIQDLRKKTGFVPQDKVELIIETDETGRKFIEKFSKEIKKGVNADSLKLTENSGQEIKVGELLFKIKIKK